MVIERLEVTPPSIRSGEPVEITIHFQAEECGQLLECAVLIYSIRGMRVAIKDIRETDILPLWYERGSFSLVVRIAALPLIEGEFSVGRWLVTDASAGEFLDLQVFFCFYAPRHSRICALPGRGSRNISSECFRRGHRQPPDPNPL